MEDFDSRWQIDESVEFIRKGAYSVVALQFPDELLADCSTVAQRLKTKCSHSKLEANVFVLADSAYDSLSIDEVAANHVQADCVIHYGVASLAPVSNLPCFFVFPTAKFDVDTCGRLVKEQLPEWVDGDDCQAAVVFLDQTLQEHRTRLEEVVSCSAVSVPVVWASVSARSLTPVKDVPQSSCKEGKDVHSMQQCAGLSWEIPEGVEMDRCCCLWIGKEDSKTLFQLSLEFSTCRWVLLDAGNWNVKVGLPSSVSNLVRRRYYLVEKTRNAQIIGILVSTLAVAGFLEVVKRLKALATEAGKKTYMVVMGKPTPEKLANFPEVEVFVMVCDASSMILDSKEFLAPIVTPFEAQMALTGGSVLPGVYRYPMQEMVNGDDPPSTSPRFSFIDGALHSENARESSTQSTSTAVSVRSGMDLEDPRKVVVNSAAEFFKARRTYTGLDPSGEETKKPAALEKGRTGRAAGYTDEPDR